MMERIVPTKDARMVLHAGLRERPDCDNPGNGVTKHHRRPGYIECSLTGRWCRRGRGNRGALLGLVFAQDGSRTGQTYLEHSHTADLIRRELSVTFQAS